MLGRCWCWYSTRQKKDGILFVYMDLFAVNIKIVFLKERVFREKMSASNCHIHTIQEGRTWGWGEGWETKSSSCAILEMYKEKYTTEYGIFF